MNSARIESSQEPAATILFRIDGEPYQAFPGDTVATALYAAGRRAWRRSRAGDMRGLLCGMGVCFDCLVTVDGVAGMRACQVQVRDGMEIITGLDGGGSE